MRGRSGACMAGGVYASLHDRGGMHRGSMRWGRYGHGHCSGRNAFLFRFNNLIILWYVEVLIEIAVCCLIFSN